ncbi:hypothetical protein ACJBU6_07723 [Exserohilum turcicum]
MHPLCPNPPTIDVDTRHQAIQVFVVEPAMAKANVLVVHCLQPPRPPTPTPTPTPTRPPPPPKCKPAQTSPATLSALFLLPSIARVGALAPALQRPRLPPPPTPACPVLARNTANLDAAASPNHPRPRRRQIPKRGLLWTSLRALVIALATCSPVPA